MVKKIFGAFAFSSFMISPALAASEVHLSEKLIDQLALSEMREWLSNPVVELSLKAQNQRYVDISSQDINDLDQQWRVEREADYQPLIAATLSNPLSIYLTQIQAASLGLYTEMFVMDANGLNVGQSAVTSDFWQGDEAKFQQTYSVGADVTFIDAAEFHEASGTWRAQANMTISEGATPIGAITVEFNLTELARRQALN